jgi:CRP-like cAMP-binding protein
MEVLAKSMEVFKAHLREKAGMDETELEAITAGLLTTTFAKGSYLLRAGEVCHHAFFVEQGILRSFTIDDAGKEHIIQFAPETWIMSDRSSAFFDEPSDFYIEAVEETTVVLIDRPFIQRASAQSAAFRDYNDKALQNHVRQLQKRINFLLGASAEKRYLEFIRLYPDLLLRVPQWMVASFLGLTPEGLSRVRKEMARRNFKPQ